MRRSPAIDALFPDIRGKVLAAAFTRPQKQWYVSELSRFLHTRPSSLQREIDGLTKAGILRQWKDGRRVYVKAEIESPIFPELRSLFNKTAGVGPVLEHALKPLEERVRIAFLYGSMARSEEQAGSDIDLLVIGDLGLADLVPALRESERTLGRPVNATVYSEEEFSEKARRRDHFLTNVLGNAKLFVKGDQGDLETILGQR